MKKPVTVNDLLAGLRAGREALAQELCKRTGTEGPLARDIEMGLDGYDHAIEVVKKYLPSERKLS